MYRSRQKKNRAIRIVLWAILFVLVTAMSGCGLVADGVNHVRAIQLPPGDLYSPEFYQTATVEEVKKAIGSRSLADEYYTERYYAANTEGTGFLAALDGKVKSVQSVFIPMSSVDDHAPMYPLQVAVRNTPYPAVVTALIDAGADPDTVNVAQYVCSPGSDPEISRILLARCSSKARCESMIWLARMMKDTSMLEYCLGLPGTSAACAVGKEYPLKSAVQGGKASAAAFLLERGAVLPADADGRLELLAAALRARSPETFWLLTGKGLENSLVDGDGNNTLMAVAADAPVDDAAVLLHLAKTVPLNGKNAGKALVAACGTGNMTVLETLLRRTNGLPKDGTTGMEMLKAALKKADADLFWALVAKGADCSREDSRASNNIMSVASWKMGHDAKIIQYLADHVYVGGESGSAALRYAVTMGYAAPVRTLLERGALSGDRTLSVAADGPEPEALQAVLEEKGVAFKIR
ncbi:exported hypothetical protein [uncultured delta proteobacterium]|uniref:Uncharacterized protein n=1 Tax=uncultured delta proteobacterium TaxID=34034 RepID=A0A212KEH5_9DELT|nr:exported hypothetical protein [uncultured delta proteobacterium]